MGKTGSAFFSPAAFEYEEYCTTEGEFPGQFKIDFMFCN